MPHVTIIGGGPAGSVAAILLARRNFHVTLVEQHRFPREKVCGDCLSALGIDVLRRHNLLDLLNPLNPIYFQRAFLHEPSGQSIKIELPEPMLGLSRAALDTALLTAARSSGVEILQPARCEKIVPVIIVRDLQSNQLRTLKSDYVILADGKAALTSPRPIATKDFGIRAHFDGITSPRDVIQLFGVDGHYGGIAPIENGLYNVAFSVPAARMRSDLDDLFAKIVAENASLASQLRSARRSGEWLASPLPRFAVADRWPSGVIPIGNAAAALEPIGGEGMGLAMRSAELAADALFDPQRPFNPQILREQFRKLWQPRSLTCRLAARLVGSPAMAAAALDLARANELLTRQVTNLMGKHLPHRAPMPAATAQNSLHQTPSARYESAPSIPP
jgi:flavin-dependent dehydrogenase